jgi:hypothetical protein
MLEYFENKENAASVKYSANLFSIFYYIKSTTFPLGVGVIDD